ncbi:MAG: bifunctional precorrin-2 dehydrogenase/sirohydrochlorin ferrochelatase [Candidatus Omnitrophota bacterium]|nr:bifunctional precorrin-2 dehydrogenase/sirohydrochlorin ferrochelatase [Candidatus Omnitrophota bacterium]
MTRYYPVNLELKNKRCLVIGAGIVAERKARRLLECGARVLVIGRAITPGLKTMADTGKVIFIRRNVGLRDLNGACLVIAATADRSINSAVSAYCRKKNILVNVVDSPGECSFILPSIIRRGDLTISISTAGISPALAKKIRQNLRKAFGAEYGAFLGIMKKIRPVVLKKIKSPQKRKKFFNKILKDISGDAGI